jgi:hypothetical protein
MFERQLRTFSFLNDTGETIPPFACMITVAVSGSADKRAATNRDNDMVFKVRKATTQDATDQNAGRCIFNLETPVPNGAYGRCTLSFPCMALCSATAIGQQVGPKSAAWEMDTNGTAFTVITQDPTESYSAATRQAWLVRPSGAAAAPPAQVVIVGKVTSGGVSARSGANVGTGTIEAYEVIGTLLTATGDFYDVKNLSEVAVSPSAWVQAKKELYQGDWFIDWEDCGA